MPIARIRNNEAAFAIAGHEPVGRPDRTPIRAARDREVTVVLLGAINVVRECVVDGDVIELRGRLVVLRRPCLTAVRGNAGPAVVRVPDAIRILWINPEPVVIAMTS